MFDKNDILAMLRAGHSIEDIGEEIAEILNRANTEYDEEVRQKEEEERLKKIEEDLAKRQEEEKQEKLRDLVEELFDVLYDIGVLFELPKEDLEYADEDIDALIDILPTAICSYVETKKRMEQVQKILDDDRITAELRRFANSL